MVVLLIVVSDTLVATPVPVAHACNVCNISLIWGSLGSGNGQFNGPEGVAVDSSGNVYVTDTGNNRVEEFTGTGTFITAWGSLGSGNGQFNFPLGVAVDSGGNVYVADDFNSRVEKFTGTGTFVMKWGSVGSGNGQFNAPHDVAVDSVGNVYVTDTGNYRVEKFTGTGTFIMKWGSAGVSPGQFTAPYGVAVDSAGDVYVTDLNNNRVEKFGLPVGATSVSISLVTGWNLVSLPLVPLNTGITSVLNDLITANNLTIVWSYQGGGWKSFTPPSTGTLTTMQDGFGYWIYVTRPSTLIILGYVIFPGSVPAAYHLVAGWNLLGFKPQPDIVNETVSTYLAGITGEYTMALVYNNPNHSWVVNGYLQIAPGEAMWINMTGPVTFSPPWIITSVT
ncbi:MAG: hypothetical protein ABSC50_10385 [Candidatus Bathyarchaeia archaeon]